MHRRAKISIAAMLVGAGLAGAMLFRKPSVPNELDSPDPANQVALRRQLGSEEHRIPRDEGPRQLLSDDDVSSFKDVAPPREETFKKKLPPKLARHYRDQIAQSAIPIGRASDEKGDARDTIPENGPIEPDRPRQRLHKVVDGDNLRNLAKRYLGDANRYGEIHGANREMLADPELLPIGVVLVIPYFAKGDGQLAGPSTSPMAGGIPAREVSLDEGANPIGASNEVDRHSGQVSPANLNPAAPLVPIPPGALESK